MFKKIIALGIAAVTCFGIVGCKVKDDDKKNGDYITAEMKQIVYEKSDNPERTGSNVNLVLPVKSLAKTGKQLTAYVSLDIPLENYNYYVVDWGDGTWSYNGPYVYNETYKVLGEVYHSYKKAGTYTVRACAVNLAMGELYGWTEPQTLIVSGEDYATHPIRKVKPIASSENSAETAIRNIMDGNNATVWKSKDAASTAEREYAGYLFDRFYCLIFAVYSYKHPYTTSFRSGSIAFSKILLYNIHTGSRQGRVHMKGETTWLYLTTANIVLQKHLLNLLFSMIYSQNVKMPKMPLKKLSRFLTLSLTKSTPKRNSIYFMDALADTSSARAPTFSATLPGVYSSVSFDILSI